MSKEHQPLDTLSIANLPTIDTRVGLFVLKTHAIPFAFLLLHFFRSFSISRVALKLPSWLEC